MTEVYKNIISPFLDRRDSETWHHRAQDALHVAEATPFTLRLLEQFADQRHRFVDDRLKVVLGGVEFENPVMVGAGWDKAARSVRGLHALGFSGVEIGSVTEYPQPGNPKPRQFIVAPGVALNRLGFNSPGTDVVLDNLERYRQDNIPIGISLGKNKNIPDDLAPETHANIVKALYEHASYFAINVSSPNTEGLRRLQDSVPLHAIAQAVNDVMDQMGGRKPTFVKIAPDLSNHQVNDVIRVVADNNLAGIIATNTTNNAEIKSCYGSQWGDEAGGLSGDDPEFRRIATEKISHIYKETGGKMDILGVGGIKDAATAIEKMKAGARIVQVVTAIRSEGPSLPGKINRGISLYLEQEGIESVTEIIGSDHHSYNF